MESFGLCFFVGDVSGVDLDIFGCSH